MSGNHADAAKWKHLLSWLYLPDDATLAEVERAAIHCGRFEGQGPCSDELHAAIEHDRQASRGEHLFSESCALCVQRAEYFEV